MASYNKFVTLVLMFALLFSFSMADFGFLNGKPSCDEVYGVKSEDNCSGIAQKFELSTELFNSNNPNLNCYALFVGQWLCVAGTSN